MKEETAIERQLLLFGGESALSRVTEEAEMGNKVSEAFVSSYIKESFSAYNIPFIGCDFDIVYPSILSVVPQEKVTFFDFDLNTAILCEIVSSAICHQINWDFLREVVRNYTACNKDWLTTQSLATIGTDVVEKMLGRYHRRENVKADERARMLRLLGVWAGNYRHVKDVFLEEDGELKPLKTIRDTMLKCPVFSSDPEEKKLNLLFQKLDDIPALSGIGSYAKPAIDYHLLRLYLRRGLLYARTKYAYEFISNPDIERKEWTIAGIREHASALLSQIALYTGLTISAVNLIEWNVARSICDREHPDCGLCGEEAQWLRKGFNKCPFHNTCASANQPCNGIQFIKEPSYIGTSY
jgi:hypothetical protein